MIEGRSLLFIEADPGGDACHLLSGFAEEFVVRSLGEAVVVTHSMCQGRGDDLCRWESQVVSDVALIEQSAVNSEDA